MTYYINGNRAGKLLAQNLRGHRYRTKIPYIFHPGTKQKEFHPQKIADAFSFYYRSLYNLKNDPATHQPTLEEINKSLAGVPTPELTLDQLCSLNLLFTESEIHKTIESLPPSKSPGPDGFNGEYYKELMSLLSPYLLLISNSAAASDAFPLFQCWKH